MYNMSLIENTIQKWIFQPILPHPLQGLLSNMEQGIRSSNLLDNIRNRICQKRSVTTLTKKDAFQCQEDMDQVHHQLIEQIARISVDEEEERMRDEVEMHKQNKAD